jgi:hypothetical protein
MLLAQGGFAAFLNKRANELNSLKNSLQLEIYGELRARQFSEAKQQPIQPAAGMVPFSAAEQRDAMQATLSHAELATLQTAHQTTRWRSASGSTTWARYAPLTQALPLRPSAPHRPAGRKTRRFVPSCNCLLQRVCATTQPLHLLAAG